MASFCSTRPIFAQASKAMLWNSNFVIRHISATSPMSLKEITVTTAENTTTVEGKYLDSSRAPKLLRHTHCEDRCPLCPDKLGLDIKYTDVLVISQFLKPDGEILPKTVTGLCWKANSKVKKLADQAQRAGLLPDHKPNVPVEKDSQWKKYNTYFE